VFSEEVHVLQFAEETELGIPGAVGRTIHQRVHTASDVEADIVAVLVHLGLRPNGEGEGSKQDEYTFHITIFLFFVSKN
jgi:hypothetical protein